MKKNMGIADRVIRLIIVIALLTLYFTGTVFGLLGTIFIVASVIFTMTSILSFCPIYAALGLKTCKVEFKAE